MMIYSEDEFYPVTRITAGAVSDSGQRVFILQAQLEGEVISWEIERRQASALSRSIPKLLERVREEYPELGDPVVAARPNLALAEPLEPVFRVASIALDYDRFHDLVVLTLVDADLDELEGLDEEDDEPVPELQIFTTRGQALLLSQQAEHAVLAGRPSCPSCGEPMDDFGHFCLPPSARRKMDSEYLQ
jgi:uncharacterized repeat protein (TIGR03847 family)